MLLTLHRAPSLSLLGTRVGGEKESKMANVPKAQAHMLCCEILKNTTTHTYPSMEI